MFAKKQYIFILMKYCIGNRYGDHVYGTETAQNAKLKKFKLITRNSFFQKFEKYLYLLTS